MTAQASHVGAAGRDGGTAKQTSGTTKGVYKTAQQYLDQAPQSLKELFAALRDYCLSLGDDVSMKTGKNQFIFKRYGNFVCAEVHTRDHEVVVYLKIDPGTMEMENGFTRDMRGTSHWGTGDLEVRIKDLEQLERAKPLIQRSYSGS